MQPVPAPNHETESVIILVNDTVLARRDDTSEGKVARKFSPLAKGLLKS
jgi:hypothetical protein